VSKEKKLEKPNRYELISCAFGGHVVVGTDVRQIVPEDGIIVSEHDGLRWHRCLRCDAWIPRALPAEPTRDRLPSRDDIQVPVRGRALRDRYVLRLIAMERAVHVVVLGGLAAAVFLFIGHRKTLHHDYVSVMNALFGSTGGPDARKGLLGDFRHIFVITPSHLYDIGFLLVAYATLEAVEMIGLWLGKRWAEYLTFVATLAFVPLEVYELLSAFGWLSWPPSWSTSPLSSICSWASGSSASGVVTPPTWPGGWTTAGGRPLTAALRASRRGRPTRS
jgi:uncharacterized membrane protein (DUF2068 family)